MSASASIKLAEWGKGRKARDGSVVLSICWDDSICAVVKSLFDDATLDSFDALSGPLWFVSIDTRDGMDLTRKLVSDLIIVDHAFINENGLSVIQERNPDAEFIKIIPISHKSPVADRSLQWTINSGDLDKGVEFGFKGPVEPGLLKYAISYLLLRHLGNRQMKKPLETAAARKYLDERDSSQFNMRRR